MNTITEEQGPVSGRPNRRVSCQGPGGDRIEVALTRHALERFGERVRPALADEALATELGALISRFGRVLNEPPVWQAERGRQKSDLYIELGEDLVVPLNRGGTRYFATTVLTRSGISDKAREKRNRRSRSKRRSKHARRRSH